MNIVFRIVQICKRHIALIMLAISLWATLPTGAAHANNPTARTELINAIAELSARSGPPGAYVDDNSVRLPGGLMHESLWERLRTNFQFAHLNHPAIDAQIEYFQSGLYSLRSNLIDAKPILYFIADELDRAGLPLDLVLLPLIESAYNPHAESNRHAVGMWQFIPGTARMFGLKINDDYDGRKDMIASTRAAIKYLQRLGDTFDGDWMLAMAAYNTGPSNVRSAMAKAKKAGLEPVFWNLRLPTETRNYVPRIIAATRIIAEPLRFGLKLPALENRKAIETVSVGRPLSLSRIAALIDVPVKTLIAFNPGYLHQKIPAGGPYEITVPQDKSRQLIRHLNNGKLGKPVLAHKKPSPATFQSSAALFYPAPHPQQSANSAPYAFKPYKKYVYQSHVVKRGESLWTISRDMQTDIDTLMAWNGESDKALQPGDKMIVAYMDEEVPEDISQKLINYRVHPNDSLISITDKFNLSISELKKWNPALWQKNHLQPGQLIKIPVNPSPAADRIPFEAF